MRNESESNVLFSRGPLPRSHRSSARNTRAVLIGMSSFVLLIEFRCFRSQSVHKIGSFLPSYAVIVWHFESLNLQQRSVFN